MLEKTCFIALLCGSTFFVLLGFVGLFSRKIPSVRLFNTASPLFGLASLMQLEISGWLDSVMRNYNDISRYPYGPPSYIVRDVIDDPDRPLLTWIRNILFFEPKTGAYLAVISLIISIYAAWTPDKYSK